MTKRICTAVVLVGIAAYFAAFYMTPMPGFEDNAGQPLLRIQVFGLHLLLPDKMLFLNWFGTPRQFTLEDRIPVLLGAATILAWATLLGWLLLTVCRATRWLTRLEIAVFAAVVGLNALGTWTLFMGLLGHLDRTWLIAVPALLTLAAACVCYWRQHFKSMGQSADRAPLLPRSRGKRHSPPRTARKQTVAQEGRKGRSQASGSQFQARDHDALVEFVSKITKVNAHWLWLGLPFVLAILFAAIIPPLDFDVCEYHLQAPKEFLQQGRITFLPHNVYANMPMGAEMLSLLGMVLAGDWWWGALIGKTVIAAFTPLCALAIFAAGRRFYSTGVGVVASLVYISIPWIVAVSSAGLVEGVSACYLFLAIYALLLSKEVDASLSASWGGSLTATPTRSSLTATPTRSLSMVALAGYLAGGAAATKYPAVLFVVLPLAVWTFVGRWRRVQGSGFRVQEAVVRCQERESVIPQNINPEPRTLNPLRAALTSLTVFLLASAIGCGLWYGKNWALTGNPTYPLLYDVFGGKTWNPDKDRQWNKAHRAQDFSPKLLGRDLGSVLLTSELHSPLVIPLALLAFLPFCAFPKGTDPFSPTTASAQCMENRDSPPLAASRRLRWGLLAYVIFFIAAWWLLTHRIDRFWLPVLPVLALLAGVGAYWNREVWWRRMLAALLLGGLAANFLLSASGSGNSWFIPLEQLRDDSKWIDPWHRYLNKDSILGGVLTVGDAAVFDLKAPVLYNTCFDDSVFEQLVKGKTAKEIQAELAARNIVYVYVNWDDVARYRDTYGFTDYVQPEVFDRLVLRGVLEPMIHRKGLPAQIYRVKQ